VLHHDHLDKETVEQTLGAIIKDSEDMERFRAEALDALLAKV
jgi:hypothetical protein